jgi:hypothetical protein
MNPFENLSASDNEALLKFPAYISLIAANRDDKLDEKYTSTMRHSMKSFTEHVSKAHHNVLVDFILPLSIPGLTDN